MNIAKIIMKYKLHSTLFLLSLYPMHMNAYFDDIFSRNKIIVHPQTGLFLNYVGLYTPSEKIIHNSAIFPMTTATCYFLPLSAVENIPSCNITSKRYKRFLPAIIPLSFGIGTANFKASESNKRMLENLQQQMRLAEQSLAKYSETIQVHGAQLAKLESNQIILTQELRMTQQTLHTMLPVLNSHSQTLDILKIGMERLHNHFWHSSIYSAISQILRNDLTLNFLSPEDLNKVVYDVIHQGNVTFNSDYDSVPLIHTITKLLVRQQVSFVPKSRYITQNSEEIGRLVITNFFAVPEQNQAPFQIYTLLAVPFVYKNETIQLTRIPRYWAINLADNTTIEWYNSEESSCDFEFMPSCPDTPPLQKLSSDTCLGQILNGSLPFSCQTTATSVPPVYLRQLRDNLWITSSSKRLDCVRMMQKEYLHTLEQTFNMSEYVSLSPVALVNVTPGYVVTCPRFTLIGRPSVSNNTSLVILHNNTLLNNNMAILDVYHYLKENTAWFDRKLFKLGTDGVIYFVDTPAQENNLQGYRAIFLGSLIISTVCYMFLRISFGLVYWIYRHQQRDNLSDLSSIQPS